MPFGSEKQVQEFSFLLLFKESSVPSDLGTGGSGFLYEGAQECP